MIKFNQPLRVLVVEDNQVDRRMLESMLTESKTSTAFLKLTNDFRTAQEALYAHEFDVVVLDLNLPDCHGLETLQKISEINANVAIVVNTGVYEDELGLQTLSIGAQDFLIKGKYNAYVLNKVLHYALERKRLERELKNAYDLLKEDQSQLIQSEKMKVVGSLASGIAHEVKNPLATILYGITYLSEQISASDPKIKNVVDTIKEATHKANTIINDLLDFSNLSKLTIQPENINEVIEASLLLVHHEFEKRHVELKKFFDPDLAAVPIDRNRVEQVLINVLLNALQAMTTGGILSIHTEIQILSERVPEFSKLNLNGFKRNQKILKVSVEDTGCGIPVEVIDKIYDPFFTTRREIGGLGLGLSVSQNIMENHSGRILIENRKEGGARAILIFKI